MTAIADSATEEHARDSAPVPRLSHDGDRTVVWLQGDQDIATAGLLADALATAIASDDDSGIVVDLTDVDFLGAAAIGVILRGRGYLRETSRDLSVRSPSRGARRLLEACGLVDLLGCGSPDQLG